MDLIKTGLGLRSTFQNAARIREILTVFARNGLDEFIIKFNLHRIIPGLSLPVSDKSALDIDRDDFWLVVGYRLRKSFEELGPAFIKLGQFISNREDIFDSALVNEMKKLQDQVKSEPWHEMKAEIEKGLMGKSISDVFSSIEEVPIATASVGAVYKATLISGDSVVVKVRKPGIEKKVNVDLTIVKGLVAQVEKLGDDIKYLGLSRMLSDFHRQLRLELNFHLEQKNLLRMQENLSKVDDDKILKIPNVVKDLTSRTLLVQEFLDGVAFNKLEKSKVDNDLYQKLMKAVHLFVHSLFKDGFFHADLHGGNFMLLHDGRIGILDFGSMGSLSKKNRSSLIAIMYSLMTYNFENLTFELLDVADYDVIPDHKELTRALEEALTPYVGLSAEEINPSDLSHSMTRCLTKFQIYLPREWFMVFRALSTLDGVGRSLGLNINAFELLDEDIESLISTVSSKDEIVGEALWFSRDLVNSLRIVPKHLSWFLSVFSKNNYALEFKLKGVSKSLDQIAKALYCLSMAIIGGVFTYSGLVVYQTINQFDYLSFPPMTLVLWSLAFLSFSHGIYIVNRSQRDR